MAGADVGEGDASVSSRAQTQQQQHASQGTFKDMVLAWGNNAILVLDPNGPFVSFWSTSFGDITGVALARNTLSILSAFS